MTLVLVGTGQLLVRETSHASIRDTELIELCAELRVQASRVSETAALAELARPDRERRLALEERFRDRVRRLRGYHERLFSSLNQKHRAHLTNARRFENDLDLSLYSLEKLTRRRVDPTWRRQASAEAARRYRASLASLQAVFTRSARGHAEEVHLVGLIVLGLLVVGVIVQLLAVSGPAAARARRALAALEG